MNEYIVYHPGTGTIVSADESCLILIDDLPAEVDDWEDYLSDFDHDPVPAYKIAKGSELL